jgi:periplasmic mercuric ion binding protein
MKRAFLALSLAATLFAAPVFAANRANVTVNGMVCDFCVQGLKKTFGKRAEVSGIDVSLEQKRMTLDFKPNKNIDDETITKLITDNGLSVGGIKRE